MANKDNISHLSKYQMRILYYKCKEGATHAEIASLLDKDVNTVQYHMTKIYTILEIRKPGKSKEEMNSELLNEICPIIREMFATYDDVKIWAPVIKDRSQEENENPGEDIEEPVLGEPRAPYQPPPSVEKILNRPDRQLVNPEILEPPPPGRRRINWRLIIGFTIFGLFIIIFMKTYPLIFVRSAEPTHTPQPILTSTVPFASPTDAPANTLPFSASPNFTAKEMTDSKDGMVLVPV
ncbi:MAG TPA: sigma-70 region 4 domain-containing protein, partial [Anaerolineales bacterium]